MQWTFLTPTTLSFTMFPDGIRTGMSLGGRVQRSGIPMQAICHERLGVWHLWRYKLAGISRCVHRLMASTWLPDPIGLLYISLTDQALNAHWVFSLRPAARCCRSATAILARLPFCIGVLWPNGQQHYLYVSFPSPIFLFQNWSVFLCWITTRIFMCE